MRLPNVVPIVVLAATSAFAGVASSERADALFESGNFVDAEKAYARALSENPLNTDAEIHLGSIALFANRLDEAEAHFRSAAAVPGANQHLAQNLLGEVLYRRNRFDEAAASFRAAGDTDRAQSLEAFAGKQPYQIEGTKNKTQLKLVSTDPMPVVRVRVNGGDTADFGVDTGVAEVVLSPSYAAGLGIEAVPGTNSTRIETLTMADSRVNNVPARITAVPEVPGRQLQGVIGTALLQHFLATLDYPGGQLVLRYRSPEELRKFERQAKSEELKSLPIWMVGNRVIVASNGENQNQPGLFQVVSGSAHAAECEECRSYAVRIAGTVSGDLFRSNAVTLDFTGMRLFINPRIAYPAFAGRGGVRPPQPMRPL